MVKRYILNITQKMSHVETSKRKQANKQNRDPRTIMIDTQNETKLAHCAPKKIFQKTLIILPAPRFAISWKLTWFSLICNFSKGELFFLHNNNKPIVFPHFFELELEKKRGVNYWPKRPITTKENWTHEVKVQLGSTALAFYTEVWEVLILSVREAPVENTVRHIRDKAGTAPLLFRKNSNFSPSLLLL